MKKITTTFPLLTGRTYQKYRKLFLAKPGTEETFPFGPEVAVYKVKGKMFATLGQEDDVWSANLKCDPIWALSLRKKYPSIQPGYHMNKRHWNTVVLDGSLPPSLFHKMVELSYVLVSPAK
jgi:predicted DNA-binding protein (MmcQ/YjbR family)